MRYAELCTKTCFSFLHGASHPEEMVQTAYELGYASMAITDFHGFYGMVRAYENAKLPLIYGVEISLEQSNFILIAKNIKGYQHICQLLSENFRSQEPQIQRQLFEKWVDPDSVYVLLPPRDFPSVSLFKHLQKTTPLIQLVTRYYHPEKDIPLQNWLRSLPSSIPKAWTWDAAFHTPQRFELFEVLQSIRTNTPLRDKLPSTNAENYLKPISHLKKMGVPREWIQNTLKIAESCEFSPSQIHYQYPTESFSHQKSSFEFLKDLCEQGLVQKYPQSIPSSVRNQLEYELSLVKKLNFEDYFLTVWDIVKFAQSKNILCQGRGSAANSVICYLLGITAIDPVKMNLLFERFISEKRNEAPDIDVDFESERREEVIQYVFQKYGHKRAAMVATLITYKTRSALRDVGKALSVDASEIEKFSRKKSWKEDIWKQIPTHHKRWFRLAQQLIGFPRHLGQHVGGMVIAHSSLEKLSPIEQATMQGRQIVQWDKYDIEKLGLLKIDLLGLGMLTCLQRSFQLLKQHQIDRLSLDSIPPDDPQTYEMISQAKTVGVFQIESRAQMSMLPRLKPQNFYDLVIEVAIVRPGPLQGGMVHPYLRRRLGIEAIDYGHPKLKTILQKTLGVPIFQEQVMKMAIEVAGYTPSEADELRRAMGAWKKKGNLEKDAKHIEQRLVENEIPSELAHKVSQMILGFGEYGFPESHAASFALLTYASAYLKAHYPAVFLCALLNSLPMGFYPMHMLTSEFLREGVEILPIDLQKSQWEHSLEYQNNQWAVRLGFCCVRDLQKEHVDAFLKNRDSKLSMFHANERAALAMVSQQDRRRVYWENLVLHRSSLPLKEPQAPPFRSPHAFDSMLLDFDFMNTTLDQHPTAVAKQYRWNYSFSRSHLSQSSELFHLPNGSRIIVFGMLQFFQSPPTAKKMIFITLEDEKGYLNLILKPFVYEKFKEVIQSQTFLCVQGRLQRANAYHSILIEKVHSPKSNFHTIRSLSEKQHSKTNCDTKSSRGLNHKAKAPPSLDHQEVP